MQPATVVDQADGSYAVSFGVTRAGQYWQSVTIGSDPLASSPWALLVMSGPADVRQTYAYGALLSVKTGQTSLVFVQVRSHAQLAPVVCRCATTIWFKIALSRS